jgi:hypothetical protein
MNRRPELAEADRDEYVRLREPINAECAREIAELLASYEAERMPIWRKYERQIDEARAKAKRARAAALTEIMVRASGSRPIVPVPAPPTKPSWRDAKLFQKAST